MNTDASIILEILFLNITGEEDSQAFLSPFLSLFPSLPLPISAIACVSVFFNCKKYILVLHTHIYSHTNNIEEMKH